MATCLWAFRRTVLTTMNAIVSHIVKMVSIVYYFSYFIFLEAQYHNPRRSERLICGFDLRVEPSDIKPRIPNSPLTIKIVTKRFKSEDDSYLVYYSMKTCPAAFNKFEFEQWTKKVFQFVLNNL